MARAVHYRRWQFRLIAPHVKGRVLEIGGGIGNFTADVAGVASSVVSIEPNAYCHAQLLEKTRGLANVTVHNITSEALVQKLGPEEKFDTAVCMNVLEHIQDDEAALRSSRQLLRPGGALVLLIPAAPWLFGEIDRRLGHYRRYSKAGARAVLEKAGWRVATLRYFNFIGLWGWWWNARVRRALTQNDVQIHLFDNWIVPWQSRLESVVPPPLGQSLLVVAKKESA